MHGKVQGLWISAQFILFLDGNKRVAHAVMAVFLMLSGFEIIATVEKREPL